MSIEVAKEGVIEHFESQVAAAIRLVGVPRPGSRVVVALSGGADSVALTVVLHRLGYELTAVHCNYHLRGAESDRDAQSVRRLCERLGIGLVIKDFDVNSRREATGESVEMACRELRYDEFARVLKDTDSVAVAVGHHREDNIETFFLNLLRGSGLRGLSGMKIWDPGRCVIRPLINLTREDIESYLCALDIEWVNDSSNGSNEYKRNRLRNVVLPALREMFPDCDDRIADSLAYLRANVRLYEEKCEDLRSRFMLPGGGVDLVAVNDCGADAEMILFELLSLEGFNMSMCRDMLHCVGSSGRTFAARNGLWLVDRGVARPYDGESSPTPPREVMYTVVNGPLRVTVNDSSVIYLSEDVLRQGTLSYRGWKSGDRIEPFGMRGSKKVSDVLRDAHVALDDKRRVELLVHTDPSGRERILWVCGLRASRHFRVSPDATSYVRIDYHTCDIEKINHK